MTAAPHPVIETERLLLRPWRDEDVAPFAELNADPVVMEHFPGTLSLDESRALVDRLRRHFDEHGFGLWAVEVKEETPLIGFIGLAVPQFESHFTPCVEIGWRLAASHWGRGLATEGARGALNFGFQQLGLEEIVSFTAEGNLRSRRVMERLGMTRSPAEDFDHPRLPAGHRLARHVLYRLAREAPEDSARTPELDDWQRDPPGYGGQGNS